MPKKICFFTTHYDFPRQRMMDYYESAFPESTEIFLFCNESEKSKFKFKKTKVIGYTSGKFGVLPILRKFCRKNKINVLTNLSGGSKTAFIIAVSCLFSKTKNIYYDHGNPDKSKMIFLFLFQLLIDRMLLGADDLVKKMQQYTFLTKKRVFTLPTAIDTDFFKPLDKIKMRRKLKIKKDEKIIIFVGRIHKSKGSDYFLHVIKANPDKKFILIGKMMDSNFKLNELKNVIHIPLADAFQIREYYSASDLCLFLSKKEGLGLAYREAMACGVPTIVSDIEAVRTVKGTMKVPFNNKKIQEKIDYFFSLPDKSKKELSEISRKSMVEGHSYYALKIKHINLLLNI